MSYIETVAREALKTAHTDFVKARRTWLLVAGILALIHLLTVHPYLKTSRDIAGLEASMAANAALVSILDPEIARLKQASKSAGRRLNERLSAATEDMIDQFTALRRAVQRAERGELPQPGPAVGTERLAQQQMPQIQQMQQLPQQMLNAPAPVQTGNRFGPELVPILAAVAAGEADAYDRLINFARRAIVVAAYAQVQRAWLNNIRPKYVDVLTKTESGARRAAGEARDLATETAVALTAAADELAKKRVAVEAIEISHDQSVDAALGSDWWRTVQGKGAFADAVAQSIDSQMRAIEATAAAPSGLIGKTLELQRALRTTLEERQTELAERFDQQRSQLSSLSGAGGFVPVDLASFIGLFPLVLGLVLGLLLLRVAQARRDAALAAADLALAAPDDQESRAWLGRRLLGGASAAGALWITAALAAGTIIWLAFAASQLAQSPIEAPLAPWISGTLAALVVIAAGLWDGIAVRRLTVEIRR